IDGVRMDGNEIRLELTITPLRRRRGYVFNAFIRDLTERRATEARLDALQAELLHVSRQSEMGQFGSSLVHELNQPLAAITNYLGAGLQILRSGDRASPDRMAEILTKATAQTARISEIIRSLRRLISKGATERQPESLHDVIRDAGTLVTISTGRHDYEVRYELEPGMPAALIDRIQIQQVLANLMRNAIEAMARSDTRSIVISASARADGLIEVRVADTGPGISESIAEQLFEPFVSTKADGMGVGLSICQSIIAAHGGAIWADANPRGGGAIFHFTIPSAPVPAPA
ncbi:MAG: sensor histidine kinase, partial [Stellaceae bacterium]